MGVQVNDFWTKGYTVITLHPGLPSTNQVPPWWEYLSNYRNNTLTQVLVPSSKERSPPQTEGEQESGMGEKRCPTTSFLQMVNDRGIRT